MILYPIQFLWEKMVWLLIFLACAGVALWFTSVIRELVWKKAKFQLKNKCKLAEHLEDKWGWVLLICTFCFFIYWIFVITFIFGEQNLIQGIIVGSVLTVFILFQLPRLLKPHVLVTFLETGLSRLEHLDKPLHEFEIAVSDACQLSLHITNLGINVYENWVIYLTFDRQLTIDESWLKEYKRKVQSSERSIAIRYQERNNALVYWPQTHTPISPSSAVLIEFKVHVPSEEKSWKVSFAIESSTRWGDTHKDLYLIAKRSPLETL